MLSGGVGSGGGWAHPTQIDCTQTVVLTHISSSARSTHSAYSAHSAHSAHSALTSTATPTQNTRTPFPTTLPDPFRSHSLLLHQAALLSIHDTDPASSAAVCDLLFCSTTPPDLFTFLENASHPRFAQDKALTGARKRVLQVVTRYIRLAGAQAVTRAHGERVVAVCFKVVRRDKSNTVKAEVFRPMALLIDHGVYGVWRCVAVCGGVLER